MSGRVGSITTPIISDGLVFNMDAANRASYTRTGTTVTDTVSDIAGTINGAVFETTDNGIFALDGVDDYIEVMSNGNGSVFETQTYTIDSWIKLDATNNNEVIFSYDYTAHSSPYYSIHLRTGSNGRLYLLWNNGSIYRLLVTSNFAVTAGSWLHVVALHESGRQKTYVNGQVVASSTNTDTISFYDQEVWIGKGNFGGNFGGDIASIRFYNRALSDEEVLYNYNALKGRFGL